MFNKGGVDLNSLVGLLNNSNTSPNENNSSNNNFNPMSLISSLMSNKNALGGILNMFKGGGLSLFNKSTPEKKTLKTTDYEIKNYTKVE